ncbi:lysophospholipid acyltransferase family protein [Paramagnetospirillum kuznetsovii]|uniref:lysophospholipid acyltransferase family protein n=1 Tax=Paramagnetospirillum kuznetsovii TaxID=2053833 RepID=UPI00137513B2|nr:lysophospholipid acyltransferase family protein [Paramagnetospirillum kuznetsovii]
MLLERLDRGWRCLGTGLFLAVIGLGGSFLALTVFPVIVLFVRDPLARQRRIQSVIRASFKLYCAAIQAFRVADIEVIGAEQLEQLRGALVIANHPSLLDVVMIMAALPHAQCVVKAGLLRHPFFRLTVQGAGYIPNDLEPEALMAACVATLRAGNNLIVFPEGTRTIKGHWKPFHRGFANIATLARADVQLLRIDCEPSALHKGNPWWKVAERRTVFRLTVGQCLDIRQFLDQQYRSVAVRKLVSFIETHYREVLGHG